MKYNTEIMDFFFKDRDLAERRRCPKSRTPSNSVGYTGNLRNYIKSGGRIFKRMKSACKPDSVEDNHSSTISVTAYL